MYFIFYLFIYLRTYLYMKYLKFCCREEENYHQQANSTRIGRRAQDPALRHIGCTPTFLYKKRINLSG